MFVIGSYFLHRKIWYGNLGMSLVTNQGAPSQASCWQLFKFGFTHSIEVCKDNQRKRVESKQIGAYKE